MYHCSACGKPAVVLPKLVVRGCPCKAPIVAEMTARMGVAVGFGSVGALVDAELEGARIVSFRKVPAVVTVANNWYDYSMAPGKPAPQYYAAAPLTAQTLTRSADGGIDHGGAVGGVKYLRRLMAMCVTAGGVPQTFRLLDYLLFYPFVDMGTSDPQALTNTQVLTRYTTGAGVQMMAVLVAPHGLVGDTFTVTYTNSQGVAGRVTPLHTMTTGVAVNGTILTTSAALAGSAGPFMALQTGDSGVRSIESVQCTAGTDVGLFTLVLVKPLANLVLREITAPVEVDYLVDFGLVPAIVDDAYLNFISCPAGSLSAAALDGIAEFIWD